MIVIGTAGHIDHGKSSIVKRLTGTDPDRLPEEQARGMTIDLGFAFYHTPDNSTIAFVDVPGHERFVKNMIAGAGGIDAVMLVVAADDGWMPQTQEHFQITRLLGIRHGFIVINKSDLAEPDWLELLEQELHSRVDGTFLADAPIFRVSSQTGEGFDKLSAYLNALPNAITARRDIGKARLYIDRSFVRQGIGGVVTGTLRGGTLSAGQSVGVWPSGRTAKIRSLHSANQQVDTATPGQRTAVALTGIDKEHLVRGGVISAREDLSYFQHHPVLALSVEMLHDAAVPLDDRRRVLLIVGTTEAEGEIRIFDDDRIAPGKQGLAWFRPDLPVYTLVGDHGILRLPTPMLTLGGAIVLDHLARFPRRSELTNCAHLKERSDPAPRTLILSELHKLIMAPLDTLLLNADIAYRDVSDEIESLIAAGNVARFENFVYDKNRVAVVAQQLTDAVAAYLKDHPHEKGVSLETTATVTGHDRPLVQTIVNHLLAEGRIVLVGDVYNLAGRNMSLKGIVKEAHDKIMRELTSSPSAPPSLESLAVGKINQQAIKFILDTGEGHKIGSEFILLATVWNDVVTFVRERIAAAGKLLVADLRDRFGFSRKFAIPILEETDRLKLTRREGDIRVKGELFDEPPSAL